jgi:formylglycine-generating enzyme required for sulfatase activity
LRSLPNESEVAMKWVLVFLSIAAVLSPTRDSRATTVCGSVSEVWDLKGSPYYVTCDVTVPAGQTLEIRPGVQVVFMGGHSLEILGTIRALGTEEDSIVFTTDTLSNPGRWRGLRFGSGSSASVLEHCRIEFGLAQGAGDRIYGGGINCRYSSPTFIHCTIRDSKASRGGGLWCWDASPSLDYCRIVGNWASSSGGGVHCNPGSSPMFNFCVIEGNRAEQEGGGVFLGPDSAAFTNCTIVSNSAPIGGGVACYYNTQVHIKNTVVSFCQGAGIYFDNSPNCDLRYLDVFGNTGGSFAFVDGQPTQGPSGIGQITTVNSKGDSCDQYFNILIDPMLVNPGAGDFHLQIGSPCIDTGDPSSPFDPDGSRADMGAFPFTHPLIPRPCANLVANLVASNVVLTWTDPTQDTLGRPITIDNVEVWLEAAETGTLLAIVDPGVQTYTHHKNENGCRYCVRALAGEYCSTSECVETQDLCDTTGIARNMALECGTGYGIGQVGGSSPDLAADNNLYSAWYTESTTGRLVVTLRTLCALDSLVLHIATYPDGNARHIISISSDSSQWQTLLDTTAFWTDGQRLVVPVSSLDSVKYVSLYTPNSVSYVAWYEVQVFGTPILCRATLSIVPSSLDFGTISCDSSAVRSVQLNNTSAVPVPILDLFNSDPDFLPDTALVGNWVAPFSSVTLTVQFQPLAEGTFRDTLRVVSQLAGPDTLRIPMMATVPIVPAEPESLVIMRGAGTNMNIYWAPVTHSTCGHALTISQYRIFASANPDGPFNQIGTSAIDSFVHPFVLNAHPIYFYRVTADSPPAGMVYVPAGPYSMGADYQPPYSLPIHTVNVPAFYMDIYEVTNAQYKAFCDATSREYPPDPGFSGMPDYFTNSAYANYPVVYVTWDDARAYAAWAGKRLPTEAEWERAAKGNTDNRQYPWGDTWVAANANIYDNPTDGCTYTAPVGTYPNGISPAGCYDMAGNVWEWCEDDWHEDYNGAPTDGSAWIDSPRESFRVDRGGSWGDGIWYPRCAIRGYYGSANRNYDLGFRCARTP